MLLDLAQIICKTNIYIYIYIVIHSFIEFFRVWFLEQTVWSNNKVAEWMLSCKYGLVHTPIATSFCYFGLWLPGISSLSLSIGAPHISCVFFVVVEQHNKYQGLSRMWVGKKLQKCVKWLQLLMETKVYTLRILNGLKDWKTWGLARWCQVGGHHLPKIRKQLRRLQTLGQRPSNDTKIDGGSTGH